MLKAEVKWTFYITFLRTLPFGPSSWPQSTLDCFRVAWGEVCGPALAGVNWVFSKSWAWYGLGTLMSGVEVLFFKMMCFQIRKHRLGKVTRSQFPWRRSSPSGQRRPRFAVCEAFCVWALLSHLKQEGLGLCRASGPWDLLASGPNSKCQACSELVYWGWAQRGRGLSRRLRWGLQMLPPRLPQPRATPGWPWAGWAPLWALVSLF